MWGWKKSLLFNLTNGNLHWKSGHSKPEKKVQQHSVQSNKAHIHSEQENHFSKHHIIPFNSVGALTPKCSQKY